MNKVLTFPLILSQEAACRRLRRFLAGLACLAGTINASEAHAQYTDEVIIRGSTPGSRITMRCEVLDYTGRKLVARPKTGRDQQVIPADEVVVVRTPETKAHELGRQAFKAGRIEESETHLKKALNDEPREWVRRDILALLTRCALRRHDFADAGSRFQMLFTSDPSTPHMDLIPLVWTDEVIEGEARSSATAWMRQEEPVAKLIGASLLFFDPSVGQVARNVLSELNRTPGDRIRRLAWWQQWRLRIHSRDVTEFDVERWASRVEDLEPALRPGPYFILGEAYLVRQDFEMAAATFLKTPLVHPSDHPVVARSLLHAANALSRIGMTGEAAGLYDELLKNYSDTPIAAEARQQLEEVLNPQ